MMENRVGVKKLVFIILVFLVVLLLIGGLFYFNLKKRTPVIVDAIVKYAGSDYILVEDENEAQYKIVTSEEFHVGDRVSAVMKNLDKEAFPIEGDVVKIDILSRVVQFAITDPVADIDNNDVDSDEETSLSSIDSAKEEDVVTFFENLDEQLDNYQSDKSLKDSVQSGFIKIVDFLFYKGTIQGYTFDELSDSVKIKVLSLAISIDSKIEEKFPNYKEKISSTGSKIYTNVKEKAVETYLDITVSLCSSNQNLCASAKEGLADLKKSFSLTWDFVKELSGIGVSKLKTWYEVWKESE